MKSKPLFEPHLALSEIQLPSAAEWTPRFRGWCVTHIRNGISYWHEQNEIQEVPAGATLVFSAEARGALRASQLSQVAITYFCVESEKLPGLLSLREQHFLREAAGRKGLAARAFPVGSPISDELKNLSPVSGASAPSLRLRLLQLFMGLFDWGSDQRSAAAERWMGGRERFRQIINQMAASEFVELSITELAPMMSCSPRHLNRLFRTELGASFREKQIELRLARACELLAGSDAKVVEVALESGYQSSSVFSELFKRRFGVSPGLWRRQRLKGQEPPRIQF